MTNTFRPQVTKWPPRFNQWVLLLSHTSLWSLTKLHTPLCYYSNCMGLVLTHYIHTCVYTHTHNTCVKSKYLACWLCVCLCGDLTPLNVPRRSRVAVMWCISSAPGVCSTVPPEGEGNRYHWEIHHHHQATHTDTTTATGGDRHTLKDNGYTHMYMQLPNRRIV
jgi:hypothetical protein